MGIEVTFEKQGHISASQIVDVIEAMGLGPVSHEPTDNEDLRAAEIVAYVRFSLKDPLTGKHREIRAHQSFTHENQGHLPYTYASIGSHDGALTIMQGLGRALGGRVTNEADGRTYEYPEPGQLP